MLIGIVIAAVILGIAWFANAPSVTATGASKQIQKDKIINVHLNKKTELDKNYYFVCQFNQKPSIGINILKVQILDRKNKKVDVFTLKGSADMTQMRGMHGSGDTEFKRNKARDYLLPVDIVMRGEWEVVITFIKGKNEYRKAKIRINI